MFVETCLTTIIKQCVRLCYNFFTVYFFGSSVMGLVTSMYDVACLLVTAFVSYYGGQQSKAKWLGWALFLLSIANFTFILPHLIIGDYDAGKFEN